MSIRKLPAFAIIILTVIAIQLSLPSPTIAVLPFIICAISTGVILYFDVIWIKRVALVLYVLLSLYQHNYVFFLPILAYSYYRLESQFDISIFLIPLLSYSIIVNFDTFSFVLIGLTAMAIVIKHQALSYDLIREKLHMQSDDMRELSLSLTEQNRQLLEHQDEFVHLATLDERNRIAREIHDHVGHQLTRVLLQIGALLTVNKDDSALLSMKSSLDNAMDSLRKSVHDLHDTSLDLESQLKELISEFDFCPIRLSLHLFESPSSKLSYAILAIVKEGLSNIIKHSAASKASVSLIEHPSFYQLIIYNDSDMANHLYTMKHQSTITPDALKMSSSGIGLKNIERRVDDLGGRFLIRTQTGYELFITFPKS